MSTAYTIATYKKWLPRQAMEDSIVVTSTFTPATLVTGDTYKFFYIPAGMWVHSIGFVFAAMDTDMSPTLALSIGDSSSGTLFLSSDTTAQAGGAITTVTGLPKYYSSANYLIMTATTGAATGAAAAIPFMVRLSVDKNTNILG